MIICREQAICIFYCKEFTEENVAICSKKIEDIGDVDICYLVDPTDPVLVLDIRVNTLPFKFHRYISNQEESNSNIPSQETQEKERVQLNSLAQVVQFINEVFVPFNPHNHAVYTPKQISTKDVFRIVSGYTDYFDNKNIQSFTTWSSKKKLHFFKAEEMRKKQKTENDVATKRVRMLYVMKEGFIGNVKLPALQK
ncbi:hypothetical protein BDB01DRAFT_714128 [Pilobolus umbonatus]|nr:hypothetical protein BDB01DRAFT_714128 [Pilobolus umbonatus]